MHGIRHHLIIIYDTVVRTNPCYRCLAVSRSILNKPALMTSARSFYTSRRTLSESATFKIRVRALPPAWPNGR